MAATASDVATCVCPYCNGSKAFVGVFPRYIQSVPKKDRKAVISILCDFCKGTGKVSQQRIAQYEAGQELKKLRLSKNVGLRKAAERLNLLPSRLAGAENGRESLAVIAEVRKTAEAL